MIEYLFRKSISDYGYNRDNSENINVNLRALKKFLFTMLVNPKETKKLLIPVKLTRNFIRRFFILFAPLMTPKVFTIL